MGHSVKLVNVCKTFPGGVVAVDNVSLELEEGVLYGYVGPNGAGKSTLTNLISGYYTPDRGEIYVHGVRITDFHKAISEGVVKVEQHPNLAPWLTPAEHLALLIPKIFYNVEDLKEKVEELIDVIGVKVDLDARVEDLPIGHLRVFEIVKALTLCDLLYQAGKKPILILDEATAFLPIQQKKVLKDVLRGLTPLGYTIILISHDLAEVIDVSDEILVMTMGKIVARFRSEKLDMTELIRSMFDTVPLLESAKTDRTHIREEPALKIESLKVKDDRGHIVVRDLDLTVYAGEVHGVVAIPGTGEKELAECIYGLRSPESGRIILFGEDITKLDVSRKKMKGLSFISDDRIRDGLIPEATVEDNMTIGSEDKFTYLRGLLINTKIREALARQLIREYSIIAKDIKSPITTLSGGNMQRAYLARIIGRLGRLLIALHPTIGLDPMGTKIFFDKVGERKAKGLTTLIFSPNIKELIAFCDRISVMSGGRIIGTFKAEEADIEKLGLMVSGVA
ncbi:MAG: ATP-binding cassette domain-containing protein [Candidatus Caldarchaeales archaeon]